MTTNQDGALSDTITDTLHDLARPDGIPARTCVVMASIENARTRIDNLTVSEIPAARIGQIAAEELAKIFRAKYAYDRAVQAARGK